MTDIIHVKTDEDREGEYALAVKHYELINRLIDEGSLGESVRLPLPRREDFFPVQDAVPTDQSLPVERSRGKKIPVVEIFGPTIEGEGNLAGTQTYFIRFGLCDYKCTKCDSMHAVDPKLVKLGSEWLYQDEICELLFAHAEKVAGTHIKHVTFSGGNPAIHDLSILVDQLRINGWTIFVETQGTKNPKWLRNVDHIVVSPKSPGMGETFSPTVFREFLANCLHPGSLATMSIKIVVFSAQDLEFAVGVAQAMRDWGLDDMDQFSLVDNFYLSLGNPWPPVFAADVDTVVDTNRTERKDLVVNLLMLYNNLSMEIMNDHRLSFAKFLPQLHVLVWGNETGK